MKAAFSEAPLPDEPTQKKINALTAETDDLLGMEVDMEASKSHFDEDDFNTEPVSSQFTEVPEITEDDMMLQLDSEIAIPEADL